MNILIAVNGSEESLHAVRKVAMLPFREPPKVHLLVAIMIYYHLDLPERFDRELAEQQDREATEAIRDARAVLASTGWEVHSTVHRGHPNSLIIDRAAAVDADLIALGTAGRNAAFRVLLGSTADYVANHARCSVLVVRPDDTTPDGSPLRGVAIAYDEGSSSRAAVDQAMQFDWGRAGIPVVLLRTLERPSLLVEDEIYDANETARAGQKLATIADEFRDRCELKTSVREAVDVGHAISQECVKRQVSLVFVGDTGKGAIGRIFLGSVSRHVLHTSRGGTWIARAKGWKSS